MFRYIQLCLIHFLCIVLILKCLNFILPSSFTSYYLRTANFLLCAIIAKFTFGYSRKLFFNETVQPEGKTVLITGCARGFGKLIAQHLDSKGFHVFASCLNPDSPGADDLRKSCSSRLQVLQLDVTKDESVQKALHFVKTNLGSSELWAVINNAGIQKGFLTELTRIQDFQETMEVNAFGQVRVTKAFLPLLRKSRGRVINIASIAGRMTLPMCAAYTMSKFASVGFSEVLRHELDMWGVRVISIEPEVFETDLAVGKNITLRVDEAFDSADEEVRKDYGEEFLKNFKSIIARAFPPSQNMNNLLADIECAVSLKNPDAVYKVYRNPVFKFLGNIFELYPEKCKVFAKNIYLRLWGLSKPKNFNKMYEN